MIKRLFLLGLLTAVAVTVLAGQRKYEKNTTMELPLADSVIAETTYFKTPYYANRVYAKITIYKISDTTGAQGGNDFGKEDSLIVGLYAVYADNWRELDAESTVYAAVADGASATVTLYSDFNADTLFTEKMALIVRFADTSSAQDSIFTIPYRYQVIHTFQ